jgi:hypothetical protein
MQKTFFNYLGIYSEKGNCVTETKYVHFKANIGDTELLKTKISLNYIHKTLVCTKQ